MNLDDIAIITKLDPMNYLSQIEQLPIQLVMGWTVGYDYDFYSAKGLHTIVICGVGDFAISADLLVAYIHDKCPLPIIMHRDYGLPAFASGKETLVICLSYTDEEETLDAFETARKNGCPIVAVCTSGELAVRAKQANVPVLLFEYAGQPRAAVGYSFGLLLALFVNLGLIPDQAEAIQSAVDAMKESQLYLRPDVETVHNLAKRYAGQLMGRWVTVFGAGMLAPVARRFKTQINEVAKAAANFEFLPEADHNALAGTAHPTEVLSPHIMSLFLRAPSDHPRNRLRLDLTKQMYMLEGLNTDFLDARGDTPLAHMWTMILFGDYMAYYLAIAYGVDPTPVDALVSLKSTLKERT